MTDLEADGILFEGLCGKGCFNCAYLLPHLGDDKKYRCRVKGSCPVLDIDEEVLSHVRAFLLNNKAICDLHHK